MGKEAPKWLPKTLVIQKSKKEKLDLEIQQNQRVIEKVEAEWRLKVQKSVTEAQRVYKVWQKLEIDNILSELAGFLGGNTLSQTILLFEIVTSYNKPFDRIKLPVYLSNKGGFIIKERVNEKVSSKELFPIVYRGLNNERRSSNDCVTDIIFTEISREVKDERWGYDDNTADPIDNSVCLFDISLNTTGIGLLKQGFIPVSTNQVQNPNDLKIFIDNYLSDYFALK